MGKILKFGAFLVIVGFVAVIIGMVVTGDQISPADQNYEYKTESIEMGTIDTVEMVMDNRNIIVDRSTSGKIEIDYYESEKDPIEVTTSADKVVLENEYKWYEHLFDFWSWMVKDEYMDVHLYLPEGVDYTLDMDSSNGDISFSNLNNLADITADSSNGTIRVIDVTVEKVDIQSSNGSMTLTNVIADSFKVDSSNGRITVTNITATLGSVSLDTSNGAINCTGITADTLYATTSNGSIDILQNGSEDDFFIDMSTSNGTVYLNGDNRGTVCRENTSLTSKITLTTSNGSINLDFTE